MLPDDMEVGDTWHHPQQHGPMDRNVASEIAREGKRRGWYIARVAARSWKRCIDYPTAQREKNRYTNVDARYQATKEELQAVREKADGHCRICLLPKRLVIDHCHTSGMVRGMLCYRCNTSLGKFADDPARLRRAADYLEHAQARIVARMERSVAGNGIAGTD